MKQITVEPISALFGAAVLGLALVAMGAFQVAGPAPADATIEVRGIPTPQSMVVIREGAPYVVPSGTIFVLTALGNTDGGIYYPSLEVDGQKEVESHQASGGFGEGISMASVPPGFKVGAGKTITVSNGSGEGRAWGYLGRL